MNILIDWERNVEIYTKLKKGTVYPGNVFKLSPPELKNW